MILTNEEVDRRCALMEDAFGRLGIEDRAAVERMAERILDRELYFELVEGEISEAFCAWQEASLRLASQAVHPGEYRQQLLASLRSITNGLPHCPIRTIVMALNRVGRPTSIMCYGIAYVVGLLVRYILRSAQKSRSDTDLAIQHLVLWKVIERIELAHTHDVLGRRSRAHLLAYLA